MEQGQVVEFIDSQRIICSVVLEVKQQRLRLLTENNREVLISRARIIHAGGGVPGGPGSRDAAVNALKETAARRERLSTAVDIEELWEVLQEEQQWIDLDTMTDFCFPAGRTGDHASAVIRAFFRDRTFFKFRADAFFPHTPEEVERIRARREEEARIDRLVQYGAGWLKDLKEGRASAGDGNEAFQKEIIGILRSVCIEEKDSPHFPVFARMMENGGQDGADGALAALVRLKVFGRDENLDLIRYGTPTGFSDALLAEAAKLTEASAGLSVTAEDGRRDLRSLPVLTIDGQATQDFDDALSIQRVDNGVIVGVHIADVGHYIRKGGALDAEALSRASSVYMPDMRIPMLPPELAEGLISLREKMIRPVISILARIQPNGNVLSTEITPAWIRVERQLTYYEANQIADSDVEIRLLKSVAQLFRDRRLANDAVQISLPEVNIWFDEANRLNVGRVDRESPGRMLVAEMMILANWLMARFLAEKGLPAVFRSQPRPKERLYKGDSGSVFQNWMQRKLLSRFILAPEPESHHGLGLDAYVTATSPIRKYYDLVTQRQIRAALGLEEPYTREEVESIIQALDQPMTQVGRLQYGRTRYWMLRHLEGRVGDRTEAIVLSRRRNAYQVLLTEFMIECPIPLQGKMDLSPEDLVRVTIQRVDARKDVLNVFPG